MTTKEVLIKVENLQKSFGGLNVLCGIDIDINWNDVLYDIFSESEQFDGYSWVRDLDEDGYVVLKHKACGKNKH